MEGLLNFIVSVQLTIGPYVSAVELGAVPEHASTAVFCVYMPVFVGYEQSPLFAEAIDHVVDDYSNLVRGWNFRPVQYYYR
jgi:hypothetical protein